MSAYNTPGVKTSGHMTSGRKLPKTFLDPKLAVESISELYVDPQARLEVVFNAYLQTSHTFLDSPGHPCMQ